MSISRAQLMRGVAAFAAATTLSAILFYRTDVEILAGRVADNVSKPYASIEIVPDSLVQRSIQGSHQWGLFYSVRMLKRTSCDEVIVDLWANRIGDAFPIANNRVIVGQLVEPSATPIVTDAYPPVILAKPISSGDYFFLLRSACNVEDPGQPGMKPVGTPAQAYICFHVPDTLPIPPFGAQHLQPVSENCKQELGEVVLERPVRRFVDRRPF